jgi:uroporphyrinogen-III synthase
MAALAEKFRREGKRVTEIPLWCFDPLGALGFVKQLKK